jgi:CheY-like chemotaxis protein
MLGCPAGASRACGGSPCAGGIVAGRTILLVDDNADQRVVYATLLEMAGHRVVTASTAAEGLGLARALRPALVLFDLCMPGVGGATAARELRADPAMCHTRVAVFSLYVDEHAAELGALHGVPVFEKPTPPSDLVAVIERLLAAAPDLA